MKKINLMPKEKIEVIKKDFERVMNLTFDFFSNKNFRLPSGESRGRINIAIFESVSYFFSLKSDKFLKENKKDGKIWKTMAPCKLDWLAEFLALPNDIPSPDT